MLVAELSNIKLEGRIQVGGQDPLTAQKTHQEQVKEGEPEKWEQLNKNKPLWMRKGDDVTNEEYASFFIHYTIPDF